MCEGNDYQSYVSDFWDTFSEEEKVQCVAEGFHPPHRCELIIVDFVTRIVQGRIQV